MNLIGSEKKIYSVWEINECIRTLLKNEENLSDILVKGEISNLTKHTSGHYYFTLKDEVAQLSCVMFKVYNELLRFELREGLEAILLGDIDLYPPKGTCQLVVKEIKPQGIGEFYLAFQQTKEKLEKEGLFDKERKRPLPPFPKRIGVVTSETGAVIGDIIGILGRRYPLAEVLLVPAIVQGELAASSIVRGIELLNSLGDVDVAIVGRGGGSIEDLWYFNSEEVARAIFSSVIPIVSAVGHEMDVTIADFVADARAPTPSAAAELVVPDIEEIVNNIQVMKDELEAAIDGYLLEYKNRLEIASVKLSPETVINRINFLMQRLDEVFSQLCKNQAHLLHFKGERLSKAIAMLDSLNPLNVLRRGYAIIMRKLDKDVVDSVRAVEVGSELIAFLSDGEIDCDVKGKREVVR